MTLLNHLFHVNLQDTSAHLLFCLSYHASCLFFWAETMWKHMHLCLRIATPLNISGGKLIMTAGEWES
jgi:hypothetical protein